MAQRGKYPIAARNVNGIVQWCDNNKRFGFIISDHGELLVYHRDIKSFPKKLHKGQLVSCDICHAPNDLLQAIDVVVQEQAPNGRSLSASSTPATGLAGPLSLQRYIQGSGRRTQCPQQEDDGSGFDVDRFESDVPKELICSVCQGVLNAPVQTACEHLFCSRCIERWLREHPSCPIDRQPMSRRDLRTAPRFVKSMIDALSLRCKFAESGCKSVVTVGALAKHEEDCPHGTESRRSRPSRSSNGATGLQSGQGAASRGGISSPRGSMSSARSGRAYYVFGNEVFGKAYYVYVEDE